MTSNHDEGSPVLHIGWWRNGYHHYGQWVPPTGATPVSTQALTAPSDDPRQTGALYAIAIAGVWAIVTLGFAAPSVPIAALLGWLYGKSFKARGGGVWSMAVLAVIGTDLVFALMLGLPFGAAMAVDNPSVEPMIAIAQILGGIVYATSTMAALGLLLLGAPGLLIAAISASVWHHLMRRKFSEPAHEGGDRGSGDQPR